MDDPFLCDSNHIQAQLWGLQEAQGRVPLHPLPLPSRDLYGPSPSIRSSCLVFGANLEPNTRRPWPTVNLPSPPAASSKPSLDGILCTSLVALTNKHRQESIFLSEASRQCKLFKPVLLGTGRASIGSSLDALLLIQDGLLYSNSWFDLQLFSGAGFVK